MPKRGRIATPVELIKPGQCIELDGQLIIRVSKWEWLQTVNKGTLVMLSTYADRIQLVFDPEALVDLVDESTLTRTPGDFD